MKNQVVIVLSSCPDEAVAERISEVLVSEGLAACVNRLPGMRSVYRWQGRIERGEEVLIIAKTTRALAATLGARLIELHPYDVPEVLALEVAGGSERYLDWVGQTLAAGPAAAQERKDAE